MKRLLLLASLVGWSALLLLWGCGGDDPTDVPPPDDFPDTPAKLMTAFKKAYSTLDLATYANLIHPQYEFLFSQEDISSHGLPHDRFNSAEELRIAANMFSGKGSTIPSNKDSGIASMAFSSWEPVSDWLPVDSSHPNFPNTMMRRYQIDFQVIKTGGLPSQRVWGQQDFFVAVVDSVLTDGTTRIAYRLIGQSDTPQANSKKTDLHNGMEIGTECTV